MQSPQPGGGTTPPCAMARSRLRDSSGCSAIGKSIRNVPLYSPHPRRPSATDLIRLGQRQTLASSAIKMALDELHSRSATATGTVFWITGLSGAGKTTIGRALVRLLKDEERSCVHLDGDQLRQIFPDLVGHDAGTRRALARRYSGLCKIISDQGIDVVCSTISLFHEIHDWSRANCARYVEIFLDVEADILKERDPKKIYQRAQAGEIRDVAGFDLAVEFPTQPDIVLHNDGRASPEELALAILRQADGKSACERSPEPRR